jgi:AraC-like DNA-binding protein
MLLFGSEYLTKRTEYMAVNMSPNRALKLACRMTDNLKNKNVTGQLTMEDTSTEINKNRSEIARAVVRKY